MSLDLGTLVGYLEVDASKWDKGFDQAIATLRGFESRNVPAARAAGEKVGEAVGEGIGDGAADGVEGAAPELEKAGEKAGESVGHGLATKGAAAAAGAAVVVAAAFVEALDVGAANDKLTAQLGAMPHRARMFGHLASDLYSQAWGDSIEDVNTAIGSTVSTIRGMRTATEAELGKATIKALDFSTAFEVDIPRAVATAGQLINAGLAKNSTRAFDLLTRGSQKIPAALREDLLDALDEYSQFYATLGYSGEQAVAMLVEGSKKGMYGIDKAGDSVKEFTIRATDMSTTSQAAYKTLGLDAKEMADLILKGGDDAQTATQKIIDGLLSIENPSKRANTAIALFGTPLEDLNVRDIPDFLRNLRGASDRMDDFAGASRRMGNDLNDNARTKITGFTRTVKMDLVDFLGNEVIPAIEDFADSPTAKKMWDAITGAADDLKPLGKSILPAVATALDDIGGAVEKAAPFVKTVFDAFNGLPKEMQAALVVGGTAAALSKKFTGSANPLSILPGVASRATPVPVFVTNPGFGTPGAPGGPGGKPGIPPIIPGELPKSGPGSAASKLRGLAPILPAAGAWGNDQLPPLMTDEEVNRWRRANDGVVNFNHALDKLPNKMDVGKTSAQALLDTILDVDKSDPRVTYTAPGFDELLRRTRDYYWLLDDLDDRTIETFIKTTRLRNDTGEGTTGQPPNRSGPASSGGGIFTSAQWAYVGDGGAEIVRPLAEDLQLRRQAATGGAEIDYDRLTQALLLARPVHGDVHITGDPTVYRREMLADERAANRSGRRRVGV